MINFYHSEVIMGRVSNLLLYVGHHIDGEENKNSW